MSTYLVQEFDEIHEKTLKRFIEPNVMLKLSMLVFSANLNSPIITRDKFFIDFINSSYQAEREFRPSISQFKRILDKYGCKKSDELALDYAIKLEQIAWGKGNRLFSV